MDMITGPSPLQKRKVVSSHYHHHQSPLSDEKRRLAMITFLISGN